MQPIFALTLLFVFSMMWVDLSDDWLGKVAEKDQHMLCCRAGGLGRSVQEEKEGLPSCCV